MKFIIANLFQVLIMEAFVTYDVDVYVVNERKGEAILAYHSVFDFPREFSYSRCSDSIRDALRELGFVCEFYFVITQELPF